jgi:hypothetical protein
MVELGRHGNLPSIENGEKITAAAADRATVLSPTLTAMFLIFRNILGTARSTVISLCVLVSSCLTILHKGELTRLDSPGRSYTF